MILVDEAAAIARYERWHAAGAVPPQGCADIRAFGVPSMEIYPTGNRLVMVMETAAGYQPAREVIEPVRKWESKMDCGQRPLPWPAPEAKWTPTKKIFSLAEQH